MTMKADPCRSTHTNALLRVIVKYCKEHDLQIAFDTFDQFYDEKRVKVRSFRKVADFLDENNEPSIFLENKIGKPVAWFSFYMGNDHDEQLHDFSANEITAEINRRVVLTGDE